MKKTNKKTLIVTICIFLLAFLTITFLVTKNMTTNFDERFYNLIPKNQFLTEVLTIITNLGSTLILSLLAIILFIIIKNKKKSFLFPINLALIGGINHLLKQLIRRQRPINRLTSASGFSFPSGHTASSLAFYGLLIYYVYKNVQNKTLKIIYIIGLSLLILLIGLSRIYLRAHYLTDIIGAYTYTIPYLLIFINIVKQLFQKNNISDIINPTEKGNIL